MLGCLIRYFLAFFNPQWAKVDHIMVEMIFTLKSCSFCVKKFCEILCIMRKNQINGIGETAYDTVGFDRHYALILI